MKKLFTVLSFAVIGAMLTGAGNLRAQDSEQPLITFYVPIDSTLTVRIKGDGNQTVTISGGLQQYDIKVGNDWVTLDVSDPDVEEISFSGYIVALDCSNNRDNLDSIDISKNPFLTELYCSNNQFTVLDVSKNPRLTRLDCSDNRLTSLDVSWNRLTSLNMRGNPLLTKLDCRHNFLTDLDVSRSASLIELRCAGNLLDACALDQLFRTLPVREEGDDAKVYVEENNISNPGIYSCRIYIAGEKEWKVMAYLDLGSFPHPVELIGNPDNYACKEPDFNHYITLKVDNEKPIRFRLKADAVGTPVRIGGDTDITTITVDTVWTTRQYYPKDTTITVYGEITEFDCSDNKGIITALDVSENAVLRYLDCSDNSLTDLYAGENTALTYLDCSGNNLNACDLDQVFRSLPVRQKSDYAQIYIKDGNASNYGTKYCRTPIANVRNWMVMEYVYINTSFGVGKMGQEINNNSENFACMDPNLNNYITLTVKSGAPILLAFNAPMGKTPVRIVSGSNTQDIMVGTDWTGYQNYTSDGTTMIVYGDITEFECGDNEDDLTALDVRKNPALQYLGCYNSQLTSLDLSRNLALKDLSCGSNQLTSLDVSKNMALTSLNCRNNQLTSLDLSKNMDLTSLNCASNQLTSLDVSWNSLLTDLSCENNQLTALDVTQNTVLRFLCCYDNKFSTAALDAIYCALPDRTGKEAGRMQLAYDASSTNHATVVATTKDNATTKNWKVQYYLSSADIPETTGSYLCTVTSVAEMSALEALTLYPNPVREVLHVEAADPVRTIHVYNVYGAEVASAVNSVTIHLAHLPAGVYVVRVATAAGTATHRVMKK